MNETHFDAVLSFWFADRTRPLWFRSTPEFDAELCQCFEATWQAARTGGLADWEQSACSALALVIVLDQFPLNIYRGQGLSYSTEAQAREVAARAIARGWDAELDEAGKTFLYLPFMHSESLADQDHAIALYAAAGMTDNEGYARHHREIVRRFGRFPHRNDALGRQSSAEELAWLASKEAFLG
ncbi:MAG: DUF924 domain-containing protein [Gammaproteobacteria bacterium]|nr:DUF924 domain-containing protein [Gammaproteobacteria bacterium]